MSFPSRKVDQSSVERYTVQPSADSIITNWEKIQDFGYEMTVHIPTGFPCSALALNFL